MKDEISLPKKVINSEWRDDVDYQEYKDEGEYISPSEIKKTTIEKIKKSPIKLAIKNLVDWKEVKKELSL